MTGDLLRNRTFDELEIGERADLVRVIGREDIELFAAVSGDVNPAHLDPTFAATDVFGHIIAHGMWTAAMVSAVLGTRLPGPGTIYLGQELKFLRPVVPGDAITATVVVREKRPDKRIVLLDTTCTNQKGERVLVGVATVIAPDQPIAWPRMELPVISVHRHGRYDGFLKAAAALPLLPAAVIHPCSPAAIRAAVELRALGLCDPILVGPEPRIRAAAEAAELALDGFVIEHAPHSHAAAARAVALAASGRVGLLVRGSLKAQEALRAMLASSAGLRTERRMSHVYAMDVPAYDKPLLVTDAGVNIRPGLMDKRDICQNAVDLLHALGVERPRVAALAAVETVDPKMQATLDAAALTVMAARGQITGATVDGPLAIDNAVDLDTARTRGVPSAVAGVADILLAPDLEGGNLLAKQLLSLANASAAGLVLGGLVPLVLNGEGAPLSAHMVSAALAKLVATGPHATRAAAE